MNILFINHLKPVKNVGGIEMVTGLLGRKFMEHGHAVYCLWNNPGNLAAEPYEFTDSRQLSTVSVSEFSEYIHANQIDEIIVQAYHDVMKPLRTAIDNLMGDKPSVTFVLHSSPGWELLLLASFKDFYQACLRREIKLRQALQISLWPLYKFLKKIHTQRMYTTSYKCCDSMMLLSKYFIPEYKSICSANDDSKYCSLPNPCTFTEIAAPSILQQKEKRVLIVSRLLETQKKLSIALSIWQRIELSGRFDDWRLDIVGNGPDETYYKEMAKSLQLRNVTFYGRQVPNEYYRRSAIFMMTSEYEGWSLTLLESQQYGCVPMAFASFAAVKEIIKPQVNGELIDYPDEVSYLEKLQHLMSDDAYRKGLGEAGLRHVAKFSIDKVADLWYQHFNHGK